MGGEGRLSVAQIKNRLSGRLFWGGALSWGRHLWVRNPEEGVKKKLWDVAGKPESLSVLRSVTYRQIVKEIIRSGVQSLPALCILKPI